MTFIGHTRIITYVVYTGSKIISASVDKTFKVWNLEAIMLVSLNNDIGMIKCVLYRDNKLVYSDSIIRIWDLDTYECTDLLGHSYKIKNLFSYGSKFVSTSYDNTIRVWNENKCELIFNEVCVNKNVFIIKGCAIFDNGSEYLEIWNLDNGLFDKKIDLLKSIVALPNNDIVGVSRTYINIYNLEKDELRSLVEIDKQVTCLIKWEHRIVYTCDNIMYILD